MRTRHWNNEQIWNLVLYLFKQVNVDKAAVIVESQFLNLQAKRFEKSKVKMSVWLKQETTSSLSYREFKKIGGSRNGNSTEYNISKCRLQLQQTDVKIKILKYDEFTKKKKHFFIHKDKLINLKYWDLFSFSTASIIR